MNFISLVPTLSDSWLEFKQKGRKILLWNQVKSRMEACYSELILVWIPSLKFNSWTDSNYIRHVENELYTISLKVLTFTVFLSMIDVSSDYIQGYLLYQDPDLWQYGILTFVINWLPGVVASVHLLTYQRQELGFVKTFFGCGKI